MIDKRVKSAFEHSTRRVELKPSWKSFGKRNPFYLMRLAIGVLLAFVLLGYLFGSDRAKGNAIRIGVIGMLATGCFVFDRAVY